MYFINDNVVYISRPTVLLPLLLCSPFSKWPRRFIFNQLVIVEEHILPQAYKNDFWNEP